MSIFSDAERSAIVADISQTIRDEIWVSVYGGCGCVDTEIEDIDTAADSIVAMIEKIVKERQS